MSDKLDRVELNIDMYDDITGGVLKWRYDPRNNRYKVCSMNNPGVEYGVSLEKTIDAQTFSKTKCHGMDDAMTLAELEKAGYIWKL